MQPWFLTLAALTLVLAAVSPTQGACTGTSGILFDAEAFPDVAWVANTDSSWLTSLPAWEVQLMVMPLNPGAVDGARVIMSVASVEPGNLAGWVLALVDGDIVNSDPYDTQMDSLVLAYATSDSTWSSVVLAENVVERNAWSSVSVSYSGSLLSIAVNSRLENDIQTSPEIYWGSTPPALILGAPPNSNATTQDSPFSPEPMTAFVGTFDELRVWDSWGFWADRRQNFAYSTSQLQSGEGSGDLPVIAWNLDENSGSQAASYWTSNTTGNATAPVLNAQTPEGSGWTWLTGLCDCENSNGVPVPGDSCQALPTLPDVIIDRVQLMDEWRHTFKTGITADNCEYQEGCLSGLGTRSIIQFDSYIANIGMRDMDLGTPDGDSNLFTYDECHGHWHMHDFIAYQVLSPEGVPTTVGRKQTFCVWDHSAYGEFGGDRPLDVYRHRCYGSSAQQGLTVGWGDLYSYTLPCQYIDITDLADDAWYILDVYPNSQFTVRELDYVNNHVQVVFCLGNPTGEPPEGYVVGTGMCESYDDFINGNDDGSGDGFDTGSGDGSTDDSSGTTDGTGSGSGDSSGTSDGDESDTGGTDEFVDGTGTTDENNGALSANTRYLLTTGLPIFAASGLFAFCLASALVRKKEPMEEVSPPVYAKAATASSASSGKSETGASVGADSNGSVPVVAAASAVASSSNSAGAALDDERTTTPPSSTTTSDNGKGSDLPADSPTPANTATPDDPPPSYDESTTSSSPVGAAEPTASAADPSGDAASSSSGPASPGSE